MSNNKKLKLHIFIIADFEKEEKWLRKQHNNGWKLVKIFFLIFYIFEKCEPEDVIYRLDFKNSEETTDYMNMFADYEWEYLDKNNGWLYFRKSTSKIEAENEGEIFSDNESKLQMIQQIIRQRVRPVSLIFVLSVIPQTFKALHGEGHSLYLFFWLMIFVIYVFLLSHSTLKLHKMKKMYKL